MAEVGGDDLHVAGEDNEVGPGIRPDALDVGECGGFLAGGEGDVVEGDAFALDGGAEVFVVGDDGGDVAGEFACFPAPEKVGEAVAEAGDHEDDAHFVGFAADGPLGVEFGGKGGEFGAELGERKAERFCLDGHAGEEPAGLGVGELVDFVEVAAVLGDECGDAGEEADAVWAGEFDDGFVHVW